MPALPLNEDPRKKVPDFARLEPQYLDRAICVLAKRGFVAGGDADIVLIESPGIDLADDLVREIERDVHEKQKNIEPRYSFAVEGAVSKDICGNCKRYNQILQPSGRRLGEVCLRCYAYKRFCTLIYGVDELLLTYSEGYIEYDPRFDPKIAKAEFKEVSVPPPSFLYVAAKKWGKRPKSASPDSREQPPEKDSQAFSAC